MCWKPYIYKILLSVLLIAATQQAFSQSEKRLVRQGNREYTDQKFGDAEIDYRRAMSSDENYADAVFNAGDALYNQGKYEEAAKLFQQNYEMNEDNQKKASAMYNMGNSLLKAENFGESIEAYKKSLRLDPNNMEAKYNLAYAQDMLQQQQNQQNQQQNNGEQQDQDNQDQENQNQQDQNQQDQDQQNQDQQNQDQQNQQDQEQQNQSQDQQISKEDAERILNALANDEKEIQEKVNDEKANAAVVVGSGKNW